MNEIVKICKIHGPLTLEQTRKDGTKFRCKACRIKTNKETYYKHREKRVATSQAWKEKNREKYRLWAREDRKKNPEKYREQARKRRDRVGSKMVLSEILRIHKVSKDEYEQMINDQSNLCAICGSLETRKSRSFDSTTRLCIDHCHNCREKGNKDIRGLLCHACNIGLGKFKDNIDLMEKAISYLKKHNCN